MRDLRVTIQVDGGPFPEIQRRVLRVEREGITVQRFDPPGDPAARYAEGDRFLHPRFGRGRVLYCAGDRRAG